MSTAHPDTIDPIRAWQALRAAEGSVEIAASALGVTPRSLLELIRRIPEGRPRRRLSGVQRRVTVPVDPLAPWDVPSGTMRTA
jgi:hypothetical protein